MTTSSSAYSRIFGLLQGIDPNQIPTGIVVGDRAKNIDISNNQFKTNIHLNFDRSAWIPEEDTAHTPLKTKYQASVATDKLERGYQNIEYLERFIFDCNAQEIVPVIRTYSLFSHISSVRSRESGEEYNSLVLAEKDLLDKMLRLKFRMRFIVSLDLPVILTAWGSSLDQATARIAGLTDQVDLVAKLDHVEVAVDDFNALANQFVLHDRLLIQAMSMDPSGKYDFTKYEVNEHVVRNAIRMFDQRFKILQAQNRIAWRALSVTNWSAFIKALVRSRVEALYSQVASPE